MNSKDIYNFFKNNNILFYYDFYIDKFIIRQNDVILYQSSIFNECLDYFREVILNDKYTNNR